jgi:hypothetical protein
MTTRITISVRDRTAELIEKGKENLTASEYVEQCLLNYWELKRIGGKK